MERCKDNPVNSEKQCTNTNSVANIGVDRAENENRKNLEKNVTVGVTLGIESPPVQGFEGEAVAHADMKTITEDWGPAAGLAGSWLIAFPLFQLFFTIRLNEAQFSFAA